MPMEASRKRAESWSNIETTMLIDIWSEREIQAALESMPRNRSVWEKISKRLNEVAYPIFGTRRSWLQTKEKIRNLISSYRKAKILSDVLDPEFKEPPFYEKMGKVLSNRNRTKPSVHIESYIETSGNEGASSTSVASPMVVIEETADDAPQIEIEHDPYPLTNGAAAESSSNDSDVEVQTPMMKRKKGYRRSLLEYLSKSEDSNERMMKAWSENDMKIAELTEKRKDERQAKKFKFMREMMVEQQRNTMKMVEMLCDAIRNRKEPPEDQDEGS